MLSNRCEPAHQFLGFVCGAGDAPRALQANRHPTDWGEPSSDTLISSEALTRSSLTTSTASTHVSPGLFLWIKWFADKLYIPSSHIKGMWMTLCLYDRENEIQLSLLSDPEQHLQPRALENTWPRVTQALWRTRTTLSETWLWRDFLLIELVELLLKWWKIWWKKSKLEQCMNAELSDKAGKLRREKSELPSSVQHIPNERRAMRLVTSLTQLPGCLIQPVYALPWLHLKARNSLCL